MKSFEDLLAQFQQMTRQRSQPSVHYECRHCGTTVSKEHATCPACGSDEIATIPL